MGSIGDLVIGDGFLRRRVSAEIVFDVAVVVRLASLHLPSCTLPMGAIYAV